MNALATPAPPASGEAENKVRSIDDLLASVSASRLGCFLQCRLKFYFRYVLGLKKPKTPALHLGTSVHAVLREWNMARWHQQPKTLKELHDIYLSAWSAQTDEPVQWDNDEE